MPLLKIIDTPEARIVVVSDVPMPDGSRRHYSETGRDAFAKIIERIWLDKDAISMIMRRKKAA